MKCEHIFSPVFIGVYGGVAGAEPNGLLVDREFGPEIGC